jgi:hypothetical protein
VPSSGGTLIEEPAAFADSDFGELPLEPESASAHTISPTALDDSGDGAEVPPPVAEAPGSVTSGGIAYITVTDAAGRVLFRRTATPNEVTDALRSADAAQAEAEAAMDRISYDRLFRELNAAPGAGEPETRTS